ncbi:branched-chain amino acid ABC transporter permease [Conexibacter woesei]|uniref:Inner-membrane translocator n=1 Tax=Conexibacter woesei (strain DSM 14684 / CCUG 47730 / CIP 108061 / JCM 11494 / NBRC 100937 / ID131577) TaxID=469383 RepID=D3F9C6_CONWI|nr:branched-chain amino acid ABC transporter permease [Conexibacter woesei]ADB49093.1 inner-membrane translocator [Conexibacter woesei DSM 14684]
MSSTAVPFALSFGGLTEVSFWTGVGVLAGIYALFTLGLQLNVGFSGIVNFGQAGFMAIGAYAMAILVVDAGFAFFPAALLAILCAVAFALVVGMSSLRLRADYFSIATLAAAEAIRMFAQNATSLTGGNQGIYGYDSTWVDISRTIEGWLGDLGVGDGGGLVPLLLVVWAFVLVLVVVLRHLQRSPWGRVLRAIREDEDAARALGKNATSYRLQSLAISAALAAVAGIFLALNLSFVNPQAFEPQATFIGYAALILGGLASYWGVAFGAVVMWTLLEASRFINLPLEDTQIASLRFIVVGLLLILLMAFRPQGIFGNRKEMVLGD